MSLYRGLPSLLTKNPYQEELESRLKKLTAAQNEPFKYAAFSGGGAKGAIYSGVHEELERSGVLGGLEAVAGSSAGAMTAALIATGITSKDFRKLSNETNFEKLLGDGFIVNKDGKPLYKLMHDTISTLGICIKFYEELEKGQ